MLVFLVLIVTCWCKCTDSFMVPVLILNVLIAKCTDTSWYNPKSQKLTCDFALNEACGPLNSCVHAIAASPLKRLPMQVVQYM